MLLFMYTYLMCSLLHICNSESIIYHKTVLIYLYVTFNTINIICTLAIFSEIPLDLWTLCIIMLSAIIL